jgi:hypothetical protein
MDGCSATRLGSLLLLSFNTSTKGNLRDNWLLAAVMSLCVSLSFYCWICQIFLTVSRKPHFLRKACDLL